MSLSEVRRYAARTLWFLLVLSLLTGATVQARETRGEVRRFTRPLEFDFARWTVRAAAAEAAHYGLNAAGYLRPADRSDLVLEAMGLIEREQRLEAELEALYGDPELTDRENKIREAERELRAIERQRAQLQGLAESILQEQLTIILADWGLAVGGKGFPPIAFRFTELPYALIVSPRDVIRQDANIQLNTNLSLARRVALEREVESGLDVSALVVPVGGYGTYPTMVQQSSSLSWVTEVVAHEWIHNYLTLRPLGLRYDASDELRTMNETVATLLGQKLGRRTLERYYPAHVPPEPPAEIEIPPDGAAEQEPPAFDFREEMRVTRERVDELLAEGRIEEAEAYMEARRQVFWDQGYRIRRLNQAYFAFHGSYAAEPGGAAGDDPIGEAVRELWARIDDPVEFLRTMAWMSGPGDLETALGRPIHSP